MAYGYDLLNSMTGASQTGNALTFGYDALGRNTSQGGPMGTVSMAYDAAGRRTSLTWPDSFYVRYDRLVTGEVSAIRENGATSGVGVLATYAYDDLGRRTSLTYGNGTVTTYGFDNVSRLTSLALDLDGGTATNDVTTSFGYTPAGSIATQSRTNDLYAWGAHFNVGRGYASNGLNQLTAVGAVTPTYDALGNLTATGSDSFGYSSENLLTSATVSGLATVEMGPQMGPKLLGMVFTFSINNLANKVAERVGLEGQELDWKPSVRSPPPEPRSSRSNSDSPMSRSPAQID